MLSGSGDGNGGGGGRVAQGAHILISRDAKSIFRAVPKCPTGQANTSSWNTFDQCRPKSFHWAIKICKLQRVLSKSIRYGCIKGARSGVSSVPRSGLFLHQRSALRPVFALALHAPILLALHAPTYFFISARRSDPSFQQHSTLQYFHFDLFSWAKKSFKL